METVAALKPGLMLGSYPQKQESGLGTFEQRLSLSLKHFSASILHKKHNSQYIISRVNQYSSEMTNLTEPAMSNAIKHLHSELTLKGLQEHLIIRSFALIREVAKRTLGKRHFDVQLFGGWVIINGMIAEMETGQGKTLTASLASCTAALAGIPVHVITTNDYLASRDAQLLKPLYERLGLSVGVIVDGMTTKARRLSYSCNITHACNKQLAFDYLRDRLEMGDDNKQSRLQFKQINDMQKGDSKLLMKGLCFAIIDEADSVLIDEARTPLILSKDCPNDAQEQLYDEAIKLMRKLEINEDFIISQQERKAELTELGTSRLSKYVSSLSGYWQGRKRREHLINQALTANYLFEKNKHYLVQEGKIQIVDENTGRVMADRSWEQGLHQLIEVKEGCKITAPKEPLARISYQRFFRRYLQLSGMSGTAREVSDELKVVYGKRVVKIPTHQPSKRIVHPERVYTTIRQKNKELIKHIYEVHQQGRPVLIGTSSIAASDELSKLLYTHQLKHTVLTARQDKHEADIISKAGQQGSIIIATNIAGRGTDIELGPGVAELGGLHVIVMERNIAHRIDRQLQGRTARQGDPGSVESFLSLEDTSIALFYPPFILRILMKLAFVKNKIPNKLGRHISRWPQRKLEKQHRSTRTKLLKMDDQLRRKFAFTGQIE